MCFCESYCQQSQWYSFWYSVWARMELICSRPDRTVKSIINRSQNQNKWTFKTLFLNLWYYSAFKCTLKLIKSFWWWCSSRWSQITLNAPSLVRFKSKLVKILKLIIYSSTVNENNMETNSGKEYQQKNSTNQDAFQIPQQPQQVPESEKSFEPNLCPSNLECSQLEFPCIKCNFNMTCLYGEESLASCEVRQHIQCQGPRTFSHPFSCRYCFLTENWEMDCFGKICELSYITALTTSFNCRW